MLLIVIMEKAGKLFSRKSQSPPRITGTGFVINIDMDRYQKTPGKSGGKLTDPAEPIPGRLC